MDPRQMSFNTPGFVGVSTLIIGAGIAMMSKFTSSSASSKSSSPPRPGKANRQVEPRPVYESPRRRLQRVAEATLDAIKQGSYTYRGRVIAIKEIVKESEKKTKFFAPDSDTKKWKQLGEGQTQRGREPTISILNISTMDASRLLDNSNRLLYGNKQPRTGVLNFASATKPGGGFKNGAEAQEESIARVSTLYPSLVTREGKKFYDLHNRERGATNSPFHTHSIIYSPGVLVFYNDEGDAVDSYQIDVISCAAVNAGEVINRNVSRMQIASLEVDIEKEMLERMGRILYVFERMGVRNIVLGTFGTGVFRNQVSMVARNWASLLVVPDARFKHSFDRVIFAITGNDTFGEFKNAFEAWSSSSSTRQGKRPSRSSWVPNF